MTAHPSPAHLVERAARLLRQSGGLGGTERLIEDGISESADPSAVPAPASTPAITVSLSGRGLPAAGLVAGGGPALAESALEQAGLIAWRGKRSRIAEEFRIIQGQVLQTLLVADRAPGDVSALRNLVMVTSTRPGEGKSFSALNLAAAIARYGQRHVLLVDADAKVHSLSAKLGLGQAPGLLELAQDPTRRADTLIFPTALDSLFVLPIGGSAEAALTGPSLPIPQVLAAIGRAHPGLLVVVDAPPCLGSSDPSNLAPLVGQTVFVIEAERTRRHEVESALDLIASCSNIALLLNKMQFTSSNTFGAYA